MERRREDIPKSPARIILKDNGKIKMCSIAGLIDKTGEDVGEELVNMLKLTRHRGPDGSGVAIGSSIKKAENIQEVNIASLHGSHGIAHSRLKITGDSGIQPLTDCSKRFILAFNGEIWNYKELCNELKEDHDFKTDSDGEAIIHLIEDFFLNGNSFRASIEKTVKRLDGEYTFAVVDSSENKFILVRDPVGIKQLYYGENEQYLGFCSEKKPLWDLDLKPRRVHPGEVVEIEKDEEKDDYHFELYDTYKLNSGDEKIISENKALKEYENSLMDSMRKRTEGHGRIGIIFSGGVDSVLVALIAKQMCDDVTCYASGFADSPDVQYAKKAAKELNLKLKVSILDKENIMKELRNIIVAIESTNHLQVDVAIPIFFAVKAAAEDNIRVLLTGQGADEIFAGYPWYPGVLKEKGAKALTKGLWSDIKNLYKDTLEREDKITMYHSIELRVPYLDPDVIRVGMSISEKLKIKGGEAKYIHRKLSERMGVPEFISWRPKSPAQNGSRIKTELEKIILEMGRVKGADVSQLSKDTYEKLGSIYRYEGVSDYTGDEKVQAILNSIGADEGLH
jgi:asparagine synthase (glutamine-hydrolysing)